MNKLISGKWTYLKRSGESDRQYFRVIYVTPSGEVKKAYSHSMLSSDIKAAMAVEWR